LLLQTFFASSVFIKETLIAQVRDLFTCSSKVIKSHTNIKEYLNVKNKVWGWAVGVGEKRTGKKIKKGKIRADAIRTSDLSIKKSVTLPRD
jgi:hypothetical protein